MSGAEGVRQASEEDRLRRTIELGESLERALASPDDLRDVAKQVLAVAENLDCDAVIGASPVGDRLAAAAVAVGGNGLRSFTASGEIPEHLLLVDGLLATGAQIERAAKRAHDYGVARSSCAVVLSLLTEDDHTPR